MMHFAASFDWETLLPLVFFVLYGLAQFLGSRKKGEAGEEAEEPEVDPMERARQIREEIRRKIAERKQAQDTGPSQHEPRPWVEQPRPVHVPREERPAPRQMPRQEPVVVRKADAVLEQKSHMQRRLAEQRKRLEEARRKQEAARKQARKMEAAAGVRKHSLLREPGKSDSVAAAEGLRREILQGLSSPQSLRKVVLYREILDPPLGLR